MNPYVKPSATYTREGKMLVDGQEKNTKLELSVYDESILKSMPILSKFVIYVNGEEYGHGLMPDQVLPEKVEEFFNDLSERIDTYKSAPHNPRNK